MQCMLCGGSGEPVYLTVESVEVLTGFVGGGGMCKGFSAH